MLSGRYIFARLHYICLISGLQLGSVHSLLCYERVQKVYHNTDLCLRAGERMEMCGVSLSFPMFPLCLSYILPLREEEKLLSVRVCACVCVWQVGTCCAVREWWVRQDDRLAQGASRTATEHARIWGEVSVLRPAKQKHTGTLMKRWFKEETNRSSTSDIPETLQEVK